MTRDALFKQIETMRAQALTLAAQAESLLSLAEAMFQGPPPEEINGQCVHPDQYRLAAAVGPHPHRFFCRRCQTMSGLSEMKQETTGCA